MPMSATEIERYLRAAFPDAEVEVIPLLDDNDHFSVTVRSAAFTNKPRITQHRMVYAALEGHMGTTLHAMQLKTGSL